MNKIYTMIRQLRIKAGLNQTEMADKLNMFQSGYSGIEKGNEITVSRLEQIAKILEVPTAYFFDQKLQETINIYQEKRKEADNALHLLMDANKENRQLFDIPKMEKTIVDDNYALQKQLLESKSSELKIKTILIDYQEKEIEKCHQIIRKIYNDIKAKKKIDSIMIEQLKEIASRKK